MIRRLHDTNDLVRAFPRVHFVGIGGTGMSGIAEVMLTLGYEVSGSDNADNVATRRLASLGARIMRGHSAANVLGTDCVAADAFSNDANTQICPVNDIPDGWEGMDAGPASRKAFAAAIEGAKTILWNGPAGVFEFDKFAEGSRAIAEAIAKATAEGAFSLIGGGDSVACINKFGMADQVSYISTGGGALLEAIEGKELPGVAAICKK